MVSTTFTARLVREVSNRVGLITDGLFTVETQGTQTHGGSHYTDPEGVHDWRGPEGARHACAWMIGGALGTVAAKNSEIPEGDARYLQEVLAACGGGSTPRQQNADHWQQIGRERAQAVPR
jgi:hypothetical protein